MPKTKTIEVNPLEQKLDLVLQALKDLKDVLVRPITSQAPPDEPKPSLERTLPTNEQAKAPQITPSYPIPADFRQTVDSVLNKDFGIELDSNGDPLSMLVSIVIPEKFDRRTPSQKEIIPRDVSPKVIDRALGANGLKEWCEIVYRNFSPEIQAQIVADRSK